MRVASSSTIAVAFVAAAIIVSIVTASTASIANAQAQNEGNTANGKNTTGPLVGKQPQTLQFKPKANITGPGNATTTTAAAGASVASSSNTFTADGLVATLISPKMSNMSAMTSGQAATNNTTNATTSTSASSMQAQQQQQPYILAGKWMLKVNNGTANDLSLNFVMVHPDATGLHIHNFTQFKAANNTTVKLNQNGNTTIKGTVNILVNGTQKWTDVPINILMQNARVISIAVDSAKTDDHFAGQPIYGIVQTIKDQSGKDIVPPLS
jgi:hypothetical protein